MEKHCKVRAFCRSASAAALLATSCTPQLYEPSRVANLQQAGNVTLVVTAVAPWEEISGALQPTFNLSEVEALNAAIPSTSFLEEALGDVLRARIAAGLPTVAQSGTLTRTITDGQASSRDTQTTQTNPGTAPPLSTNNAPIADRLANLTTAIPPGDRSRAQEPILRYTAATAIFQEVRLLDRYVRNAALRHGYTPFMVRAQIRVAPYQRNLPYDTYLNIAFFTGRTDDPRVGQLYPPYVVPILVTDNLENMSRTRTVDVQRQLALAVSALVQGVAIDATTQRSLEDARRLSGSDLNSIFSIGRAADNVVQIRLGAQYQAQSLFAMVPRTHNVTLLVMIPTSYIARNPQIGPICPDPPLLAAGDEGDSGDDRRGSPVVRVLMRTQLRDAERGTTLPSRRTAQQTIEAIEGFDPELASAINNDAVLRDLRTSVQSNSWPDFYSRLMQIRSNIGPAVAQGVWIAFADASANGEYQIAVFELPRTLASCLPSRIARRDPTLDVIEIDQPPAMRSTTVETVVTVTGLNGLNLQNFRGTLRVQIAGSERTYASKTLRLDAAGNLEVLFPALPTNRPATPIDMIIEPVALAWDRTLITAVAVNQRMRFVFGRGQAAQPVVPQSVQASVQIAASVAAVRPTAEGRGVVRVTITQHSTTAVSLSARNGDIESAAAVAVTSVAQAPAVSLSGGRLFIGPNSGTIDIFLRGLVPNRHLTLTVEGTGADNSHPHSATTVRVEAPAAH